MKLVSSSVSPKQSFKPTGELIAGIITSIADVVNRLPVLKTRESVFIRK